VKSSQRRAAFAALLLAPTLAACGFSAQTDQVYQPATGINDRSGDIDVLNALIVSGTDGSGTLSTTLVNESDTKADKLTDVTGDGLTVTTPPRGIAVPGAAAVNLGATGDVTVTGDSVKAGDFVKVTLSFANGQTTSLKIPVVSNDGEYADVPMPTTSPTGKNSETPTATATPE
jgi:hypothetical protein